MAARRPGTGRGTWHQGGPTGLPSGGAGDGATGEPAEGDPESAARAIVLRQLTAAPRSRAQLAAVLARQGADRSVTDRVLDRFEKVGLVDDAAYAELVVRSQQRSRGLARRGLAHELRRKGVDDETAQAALGAVDADMEQQAATRLVKRRLAATRGLPRERRMARLLGMLARKGYPSGLAMQVVRDALDGEQTDDQDSEQQVGSGLGSSEVLGDGDDDGFR